jgi:hypothetical protein
MSYPITDIEGIDADVAETLKSVGIRTTEKLLEAAKNPKGRKELAAKTGISEKELLRFANMADRLRVKGLGKDYAILMQRAGVDTVRELKYRNPGKLAAAMAAANQKRKLVQLVPSDKVVTRWIENARKLPPKISY